MTVPIEIVALILGALLTGVVGLQVWFVHTIFALKNDVSLIKRDVSMTNLAVNHVAPGKPRLIQRIESIEEHLRDCNNHPNPIPE